MPFIVLGWHFYTFFRSKSVDLKDFIPFLVERSVVCGDVTAYLMTRCPRWWMRTWTWKPCFRQEFVDVSVFFMFCWCFVDIFMASDGSLPMTGDSRMNPLSNARHRRNGSRVWSTSWTQTWPDMAWHGLTALKLQLFDSSSVDSCALGKVHRRRMMRMRMMRTKKRKKRRTSRFGFQCFRFSARSFCTLWGKSQKERQREGERWERWERQNEQNQPERERKDQRGQTSTSTSDAVPSVQKSESTPIQDRKRRRKSGKDELSSWTWTLSHV